MATLPAVFPDGRQLNEKSHPWLLGDLIRRYLPRLSTQPLALFRLQAFVSRALGFWVVPITLLAIWWTLLFLHNWWITGSHSIMLAFGAGFGSCFWANRRKTLKRGFSHLSHRLSVGQGIPAGIIVALLGLGLLPVLFWLVHAHLKGAHLEGADLERADLRHANLQKANLQDAYLEGAAVSDLKDLNGVEGTYKGKDQVVVNSKDD